MKKKNLFTMLVAAIALTFSVTGCSNDDDVKIPAEGAKAMLSINLDTPTMPRAIGALPEDKVGNFTVFITDKSTGDINPSWTRHSANGAPLTGISVTTNAQHVYIVANAGNLSGTIATLAGLKAFKADLNIEGQGKQDAAENRWATGATTDVLDFTPGTGGVYEASTTVDIQFIAARITVKVVNEMDHYEEPGSVTLDKISVLNARGESLLFPVSGESLIPASYSAGKMFYTGYDKPTGETWAYWPTVGTYTTAPLLLSNTLNLVQKETVYYYYVFENDAVNASASPTIVTLIGKAGDGVSNLYWPVHLAPYEQWKAGSGTFTTSLTRGNSYDLTITLTGDATSGGGGTTDPTNPVVNGTVQVSVSLTPWNPIVLNKEFN